MGPYFSGLARSWRACHRRRWPQAACAAVLGVGVLGWAGGGGPPIADFHAGQARAMGLAHRAVGSSHETLLINPAGIAHDSRYALDVSYGYRGSAHLNDLALSIIDAKSAPVAVGAQLARSWGNPSDLDAKLYRGAVGFAYRGGGPLALGLTLRRQWGEAGGGAGRQGLNSTTASLGALLRLGRLAALGVAWENIFRPHQGLVATLPPGLGVGARLGGARLQAAADLRFPLVGERRRPALALGAEGTIAGTTALRLGYRRQTPPDGGWQHVLSAGLGALSPTGHLHLTLERALGPGGAWSVASGLQMAL